MKKVFSPGLLLTTAALVLLFSAFAMLTAVHKYCELRWVVGALALAAVMVAFLGTRQWLTNNHRVISALTFLIAFFVAAMDLYFLAWAWVTCSAM